MTTRAAIFVLDRGKRIFRKNVIAEAPSILAASQSSSGMVRKNYLKRKVQVAEATRGIIKPV